MKTLFIRISFSIGTAALLTILGPKMAAEDSSWTEPVYNPLPPSPEVESLININDFSVDYFRGKPQISVPIFTVVSGDLEIPITLDYVSGGRRMDAEAGCVGYNWTLSASAAIGRTVMGHPDELCERGVCGLFRLQPNDITLRNYVMGRDVINYTPYDLKVFKDSVSIWGPYAIRYYYGEADMANDLLNIAGCGLSGSFAYGENGRISLSSPQWLSISPSNVTRDYPDSFVVKDGRGRNFTFSEKDMAEYEMEHGEPLLDNTYNKITVNYVSAWHLSTLTNVNRDRIQFYYSHHVPRCRGGLHQTIYQTWMPTLEYPRTQSSFSRSTKYKETHLTRIEGRNAHVVFTYDTVARPSEPLLTTIQVYHPGSTTPAETYSLTYTANRDLSRVTRNGRNYYTFSYYELEDDNFREYYLDQDFGGYFNNADNSSLVPYISAFFQGGGADRAVNPNMVGIGCLKDITYPSGAVTTFLWESNFASNITQSEALNSTNEVVMSTVYQLRFCVDNSSLCNLSETITAPSGAIYKMDLSHYFDFDPSQLFNSDFYADHSDAPSTYPYPRVVVSGTTTSGATINNTYFLDYNTISSGSEIEIINNPGTYQVSLLDPIEIQFHGSGDITPYFSQYCADGSPGRIEIKGYKYISNTSIAGSLVFGVYWPGCRIMKIASQPNDGTDPICKDYHYPDNVTETGLAQHEPRFYYPFFTWTTQSDNLNGSNQEIFAMSSEGLPSSPLGGNEIEYPTVMTKYSIPETAGTFDTPNPYNLKREIFEYSSLANPLYWDVEDDPALDYHAESAKMFTSKAHWRGNLIRHIIPNLAGNGQTLTTEYEYDITEATNLPTLTTDLYYIVDYSQAPIDVPIGARDNYIGRYRIIPYCKRTIKEKTTRTELYGSTSVDSVVTTYLTETGIYSNSPLRELPKTRIRHSSQGQTITTYYSYQINEGFVCPIPESEITVVKFGNSSVVTNAVRRVFDGPSTRILATYGLSQKDVAPTGLWETDSLNSLTAAGRTLINNRLFAYRYGSRNEVIDIALKGRPYASYLWAYGNRYPVIEAKGVSYVQLAQALSQAGYSVETFAALEDNDTLKSVLETIRENLSGYEVQWLTYHPLIGIVTSTDSAGNTTNYEYDSYGRLSQISDFNNCIISHYQYCLNGHLQ